MHHFLCIFAFFTLFSILPLQLTFAYDTEPEPEIAMRFVRGAETSTDDSFFCDDRSDGQYANPQDCGSFIVCTHGQPVVKQCPAGLQYNAAIRVCDWPRNANCQVTTTEAPTTTTPETTTQVDEEETTTTQEPETTTQVDEDETTTEDEEEAEEIIPPTKKDVAREGKAPGPDSSCSVCGLFGDPQNCARYSLCAEGRWRDLKCHAGLQFDSRSLECVEPENAECTSEILLKISELSS